MCEDSLREDLLANEDADGYVAPDYGGYCFANVPGTVGDVLGKDVGRTLPAAVFDGVATDVSNVVVLVVDGLGFDDYLEYIPGRDRTGDNGTDSHAGLLGRLEQAGRVTPLTSIYPSETAAAMTAFHTGLTTAEHGLLGWNLNLPAYDLTIESLPFRTRDGTDLAEATGNGFTGRDLFDGASIYQRLAATGVDTQAIQPAAVVDGPYTETALAGADRTGYDSVAELALTVRRRLETAVEPTYVYGYTGLVDSAGHAEGTGSALYRAELEGICGTLERELDRVDRATAEETLVCLTADHGHIDTEPTEAVDLTEYPSIWENLQTHTNGATRPPTGGPRNLQLHVQDGARGEVRTAIADAPFEARVLDDETALASGLFGPAEPSERLRTRIGDLVVIPKRRNVWYEGEANKLEFVGSHGGQSSAEMLVPFAAARLDALQSAESDPA